MAKRSIVAVERLSSDSQALYDVLNDESDLAAVLVAVSFIDACLAALLEKFLLESSVAAKLLDARSGALGSFTSRSDVSYCLGLIDKPLYEDLLVLAEIRNQFAHHHLALSFAVEEVARQCEKLMYIVSLKNGNTEEPLWGAEYFALPRDRFVLSVSMISSRLMLAGLGVKRAVSNA